MQNIQRLEEWIRQYNCIERSLDACFGTYVEENSEQDISSKATIKLLEERKYLILQAIVKEAKENAFE